MVALVAVGAAEGHPERKRLAGHVGRMGAGGIQQLDVAVERKGDAVSTG